MRLPLRPRPVCCDPGPPFALRAASTTSPSSSCITTSSSSCSPWILDLAPLGALVSLMCSLPPSVKPKDAARHRHLRIRDVVHSINSGCLTDVNSPNVDFLQISVALRNTPIERLTTRLARYVNVVPSRTRRQTIKEIHHLLTQQTAGMVCAGKDPDEVRAWWIYLRAIYCVCLSWMLSPSSVRARGGRDLMRLTAGLSSLCGAAFLKTHAKSELSCKISRALPPHVQQHLLGVEEWPAATTQYLNDIFVRM